MICQNKLRYVKPWKRKKGYFSMSEKKNAVIEIILKMVHCCFVKTNVVTLWLFLTTKVTLDSTILQGNINLMSYAVCKLCGTKVRYSGNTTNLRTHLTQHHPKLDDGPAEVKGVKFLWKIDGKGWHIWAPKFVACSEKPRFQRHCKGAGLCI